MGQSQPIKNDFAIEHVGMTVPDLELATQFFVKVFGAEVLFDNIPRDQPFSGSFVKDMFGVPADTVATASRFIRLGNGPGLELFEMHSPTSQQQATARPYDLGLQHIAIKVADINVVAQRFVDAGGQMRTGPNDLVNYESGQGNQFWYGITPWGVSIELFVTPDGFDSARITAQRWQPK